MFDGKGEDEGNIIIYQLIKEEPALLNYLKKVIYQK